VSTQDEQKEATAHVDLHDEPGRLHPPLKDGVALPKDRDISAFSSAIIAIVRKKRQPLRLSQFQLFVL
jgi:hypothetical protein